MENSQSNIGYFPQMPVCDKHLSAELNSDFSLPDYKSEIRRLLSTRVSILPPTEYLGNGSSEISGEVIYKILYLGADGGLYNTTLTDNYSINAPLEFNAHNVNTDDVTLLPFCRLDSINTRVLGPRKLNLRSRIDCRVLALSPAIHTPNTTGAYNDASIENLIFEAPSINAKKCVSEPIVLTDYINLDSSSDSLRIVDSSANVFVSECSASTDKVNVKGDVLLKMLYCNDAESDHPITLQRRVPFSSTVYCDGVDHSFECTAHGAVTDEGISIEENGIGIELTVSLCSVAQRNESVPYVSDTYSTERATEASTKSLDIMSAAKALNGNLTQNEVFSLEDATISPDAKIIDVCGRVNTTELKQENGKLVLVGSCDYQIVYFLDGEYSVRPLSAPMRYEFDCKNACESDSSLKWSALVNMASERARSDGERLYIDSELNICCFVQELYGIDLVSEIKFGERLEKVSGELVLCFPQKNESVWSVAKLYGESQRKIRHQNGIGDGEDTVKKKYLII